MSYSIRRADLATDEDAFVAVLARNLGHAQSERHQRARWFYLDNPAGRGAVYLLSVDEPLGRVVGCSGVGVRSCFASGRSLRAALVADFAVDKEHRSLLPALLLQRAAQEDSRNGAAFAYGFPNPQAIGVFRRLGYHEGVIARYVRVLHYEPFVARHVPVRAAAALGGALLDQVTKGWNWLRSRSPRGRHLESFREPDARFDRLWQEARGAHRLIGERGADFLRWRFTHRVGPPVDIVGLVSEDSSTLGAYATVMPGENNVARLDDFLAVTPADLDLLLSLLLPQLRALGFSSAVAEFAGPSDLAAVLTAHGFVVRASSAVVISPCPSFTGDPEVFKDPGGWYITHADSDT